MVCIAQSAFQVLFLPGPLGRQVGGDLPTSLRLILPQATQRQMLIVLSSRPLGGTSIYLNPKGGREAQLETLVSKTSMN